MKIYLYKVEWSGIENHEVRTYTRTFDNMGDAVDHADFVSCLDGLPVKVKSIPCIVGEGQTVWSYPNVATRVLVKV